MKFLVHEYINAHPQKEPRQFIVQLLGAPDPAVVAECEGMFDLDLEHRGPIRDNLMAYQIRKDGVLNEYLAVDLRQPPSIQFRGMVVAKSEDK